VRTFSKNWRPELSLRAYIRHFEGKLALAGGVEALAIRTAVHEMLLRMDGSTTVAELIELAASLPETGSGPWDADVSQLLDELVENGYLAEPPREVD
jgi:hypothetical protein